MPDVKLSCYGFMLSENVLLFALIFMLDVQTH